MPKGEVLDPAGEPNPEGVKAEEAVCGLSREVLAVVGCDDGCDNVVDG